MSSLQDLNDPNKTCIYLSPHEEHDDDIDGVSPQPHHNASHDSYQQQLEVYRTAWIRCLNHTQSIVHMLHAPVVSAVTKSICAAHGLSSKVPGLPYPELPVVAVSAAGGSNTIITDIVNALEQEAESEPNGVKGKENASVADEEGVTEELSSGTTIIAHVYPADCVNLVSAMKTIISGFVDRDVGESEDRGILLPAPMKRRATMSLASYDVDLLRVWYDALNALHDEPPTLAVLLHDFEKFNPDVMQDVFYIFNQYLQLLPLVFVLSMSTPSPATYLHSVFQRSTLALVRLQVHTAPSGRAIVEELIERTFFDIGFQPSIILGASTLDFLCDFCSRHSHMLDVALSILQIAHLKHFEEPLTVLVHDSALGQLTQSHAHPLEEPSNAALLDALLTHLHDMALQGDSSDDVTSKISGSPETEWKEASTDGLIRMIDEARDAFYRRAVHMRLGYQVFKCARRALQTQGIKCSAPGAREESALELMCRVARGRVSRDINHLAMTVKKLSDAQLEPLLSDLYSLFYSLPGHLRRDETAPREFIVKVRNQLSGDEDDSADANSASLVGEWLKTYVGERLVRLDEGPLWFVWSTGSTPFPSELINPAPRMAVINALLHPHEYIEEFETLFSDKEPEVKQQHLEHDLTDLPDTSILFRRYMEAGKTINVYDWYGAFAQVLDTQRCKLAKQRAKANRGRKGKDKAKGKEDLPDLLRDVSINDMSEAEQEAWQREVQARFIRALHELDFMGFIKHTGRKADHVIRTVYDILD